MKIEQERLDLEKEETEEEAVAHFQRWAQNPKVREAICGKCVSLSPEEKMARIRQIFGMNADPDLQNRVPASGTPSGAGGHTDTGPEGGAPNS
jgi:hypothetical protein